MRFREVPLQRSINIIYYFKIKIKIKSEEKIIFYKIKREFFSLLHKIKSTMPHFIEKIKKTFTKNRLIVIIGGMVLGLINGLFGGGGGMLAVPLLSNIVGLDEKKSHATAILIILPISILSAIFYSSYIEVTFLQVFLIGLGVFIGGIIGAKILKNISVSVLTILFYCLMLFAGFKLLF